jgi:hypothetical protein
MKDLGNSTAIMMPIVIGYRLLVTGRGFPDKIMYSSFAPPNQSSILYDFNLIGNWCAKIGTGAIFANP